MDIVVGWLSEKDADSASEEMVVRGRLCFNSEEIRPGAEEKWAKFAQVLNSG
jgi:hypothetical protein